MAKSFGDRGRVHGVWGTCDLVLDGELGEKVTDERFERLMLYCGDVKHLEVRDAPEGFEGVYLSGLNGPAGSLAARFASLHDRGPHRLRERGRCAYRRPHEGDRDDFSS